MKQSPYKAIFGLKPRVGLSTTSLLPEIRKDIQNGDDLQKHIGTDLIQQQTNDNNDLRDDGDSNHAEISIIDDNIQKARRTDAENLNLLLINCIHQLKLEIM